MSVLENLEPKNVFAFFEELTKIPHGTFNTKQISDYCVEFAKERNLDVIQDGANNVIIKKGGTAGYEDSEPVIIQGHLDMVCEKTADSAHDFTKDPLQLYVEDGFVKARETTLGGDDGIAVAMIMALLDSSDIEHPPIEAVLTTDEETGMGGANAIDLSGLKGKMLINMDSEEEGILITGCAGGIEYETTIPVNRESGKGTLIRIRVHGLLGGHSGSEIHKQRGNAHKMMGRLLYRLKKQADIRLTEVYGGSLANVISLECSSGILVRAEDAEKCLNTIREMEQIWKDEFMGEEPDLCVDCEVVQETDISAFDKDSTCRVITYLMLCANGMIEYSRKLSGIVETSLNIGAVFCEEDAIRTRFQIRSSVETRKQQLKEQLEQCGEIVGGTSRVLGEYPAWQYKEDSKLRPIMISTYKELFGKDPVVSVIHAGLECGLFLGKRPDLDCVSCGPNVKDVHSVSERLDIASTQRTWQYLKEILKKCK